MAKSTIPEATVQPHSAGHQEDLIDYRTIILFGIGLVIVVGIICGILAFMMNRFSAESVRRERSRPILFDDASGLYPGAQLQEAPERDMAAMTANVNQRLSTYGWVDEERQVAHTPIDQAIATTARDLLAAPTNSGAEEDE